MSHAGLMLQASLMLLISHGSLAGHACSVLAHTSCRFWRCSHKDCLALQDFWEGEVVEVSWKPRVFLFKGFLSEEECDHMIDIVSVCDCARQR